jgi:hypothetical protein
LAAVTAGSTARAQVCLGSASFASGPLRIATQAGFADRQQSFGGEVAAGVWKSAFVSAAVQRTSHDTAGVQLDTVRHSTTDYNVVAGVEIPLGSGRAQLCPTFAFDRTSGGINNDLVVERVRGNRGTFGLSLGVIASHSETIDFVPSVGVAYNDVHTRTKRDPRFGTLSDFSTHIDYWTVTYTPAFVINRVVSLGPSVTIPFGVHDLIRSYAIKIGINVGHF